MKNKQQLKEIVEAELKKIRVRPYSELKSYVQQNKVDAYEVELNGKSYTIEIQYFWDSKSSHNIRVMGNINTKGFWSSFFPTSADFIITPHGTFIDE